MEWKATMGYDVVLIRKDGSGRHFRIHGVPTPAAGAIVSLPIGGLLIKARIGKMNRIGYVEAAEF
jgi:hypothetical protein